MKRIITFGLALTISGVAGAANMSSSALTDAQPADQLSGEKTELERKEDKPGQEKKDEKNDNRGDQDRKDPQTCKNWWECREDDKKDDQQDKKQEQDYGKDKMMRVDCRYHNDEKIHGINHCYASAIYIPTEYGYKHVQIGVGCDFQTIYNDKGRVQIEQVGERISPPTAALPGLEIYPQGALRNTGTYESVLDIRAGRLAGTCYVHPLTDKDPHGDRDSQYSFKWDFSSLK